MVNIVKFTPDGHSWGEGALWGQTHLIHAQDGHELSEDADEIQEEIHTVPGWRERGSVEIKQYTEKPKAILPNQGLYPLALK